MGQNAGRSGFAFRRDGAVLYSDAAGSLLGRPDDAGWEGGALSEEDGHFFYTYSLPVRTGGGILTEYRIMQDQEILQTVPAGSFQSIFDIRVIGGTVYRTELRNAAWSSLSLVEGADYHSFGLTSKQVPHVCRILQVEGEPQVLGYHQLTTTGEIRSWLRDPGGVRKQFDKNLLVTVFLQEGERTAWVAEEGGRISGIWKDGSALPVEPGRYRLVSESCITLSDGTLFACLTDMEGDDHLIFVDDNDFVFHFNGYFTGIRRETLRK